MPVFTINSAHIPFWFELDYIKLNRWPEKSSRILICTSPVGKLAIIKGTALIKIKNKEKSVPASQSLTIKMSKGYVILLQIKILLYYCRLADAEVKKPVAVDFSIFGIVS